MTRRQEIKLDVYEAPYFVYVNAKQNDNDSRVLVITLTDQGQEIRPDHTTDEAVFRARKPDGTCVLEQATIGEDGKITVALSDQALAVPGDVEADIAVVNGDDILSTATFYIQVTRAPVGEEVASENDFLLLLDARDRAEAAANAAAESERLAGEHETAAGEHAKKAGEERTAAETAAQLAGEHEQGAKKAEEAAGDYAAMAKSYAEGDTGSRDGEEIDNAKYYSGLAAADRAAAAEAAALAQKIAQRHVGYYATPEDLRKAHETAEDGNWAIVGTTDTIWIWDSDTEDWTDSGNKTDLSQYYTKAETDSLIKGVPKATRILVRLDSTAWVDGQQTVKNSQLLTDPKYVYIVDCAGAAMRAGDVTTEGEMTFYSNVPQIPIIQYTEVSIIRLEVV